MDSQKTLEIFARGFSYLLENNQGIVTDFGDELYAITKQNNNGDEIVIMPLENQQENGEMRIVAGTFLKIESLPDERDLH